MALSPSLVSCGCHCQTALCQACMKAGACTVSLPACIFYIKAAGSLQVVLNPTAAKRCKTLAAKGSPSKTPLCPVSGPPNLACSQLWPLCIINQVWLVWG